MKDDVGRIVREEVLKDSKVRFVLSFVVITLWSSLLQIQYALLLQYYRFRSPPLYDFLSSTSDRRYGTHSFLSLPPHTLSHSTRYLSAPNAPYLLLLLLDATSILESEETVDMPYGDDTLDSRVRDERGGEGWNVEDYDTGGRV